MIAVAVGQVLVHVMAAYEAADQITSQALNAQSSHAIKIYRQNSFRYDILFALIGDVDSQAWLN
jgi:hypothetical protein